MTRDDAPTRLARQLVSDFEQTFLTAAALNAIERSYAERGEFGLARDKAREAAGVNNRAVMLRDRIVKDLATGLAATMQAGEPAEGGC